MSHGAVFIYIVEFMEAGDWEIIRADAEGE
jgi:hypothetical protein